MSRLNEKICLRLVLTSVAVSQSQLSIRNGLYDLKFYCAYNLHLIYGNVHNALQARLLMPRRIQYKRDDDGGNITFPSVYTKAGNCNIKSYSCCMSYIIIAWSCPQTVRDPHVVLFLVYFHNICLNCSQNVDILYFTFPDVVCHSWPLASFSLLIVHVWILNVSSLVFLMFFDLHPTTERLLLPY